MPLVTNGTLRAHLRSLAGILRRARSFRPMPGDPADVVSERERAIRYAAEIVQNDLEALSKEVA